LYDPAGNRREGERYINSYAYDLLILDLMLPQMSGTELLRRVRQSHSSLPVLVLTARDAIEDKVRRLRRRRLVHALSSRVLGNAIHPMRRLL